MVARIFILNYKTISESYVGSVSGHYVPAKPKPHVFATSVLDVNMTSILDVMTTLLDIDPYTIFYVTSFQCQGKMVVQCYCNVSVPTGLLLVYNSYLYCSLKISHKSSKTSSFVIILIICLS